VTLAAVAVAIIVQITNLADAPPAVLDSAQTEVVGMFREIGIELIWTPSTEMDWGGPGTARLTVLASSATPLRKGGPVLGAAMRTPPGTGVSWVFYRSVEEEARFQGISVARLLACVIAHEIAHLLQPIKQHALAGLMRASWTREDFQRAARGELRFSAMDAEALRSPSASVTGARGRE